MKQKIYENTANIFSILNTCKKVRRKKKKQEKNSKKRIAVNRGQTISCVAYTIVSASRGEKSV